MRPRSPSRRALALSVTVVSVAIAACGGADPDQTTGPDYAASLDAACQRIFDEVRALPQKQVDEDLTVEQVQALADQAGQRFEESVDELQPPADLEPDHEQLLETIRSASGGSSDLDAFRQRSETLIGIYDKLGADRCKALQQQTVDDLADLPSGSG